jgi:hypothetical protein
MPTEECESLTKDLNDQNVIKTDQPKLIQSSPAPNPVNKAKRSVSSKRSADESSARQNKRLLGDMKKKKLTLS